MTDTSNNTTAPKAPTTVKINNKDYDIADLSPEARSYITQIQFLDTKINPLKAELAAFQTARDVYSSNLNSQLGITKES